MSFPSGDSGFWPCQPLIVSLFLGFQNDALVHLCGPPSQGDVCSCSHSRVFPWKIPEFLPARAQQVLFSITCSARSPGMRLNEVRPGPCLSLPPRPVPAASPAVCPVEAGALRGP